jgi:ubiquinone/menaquinone biosynthesis C-methylase UbiE
VDISRDKISRARAAFPDLEFIECDIARLSLPDASFDTAVLAEVLEHVDEALGAVFLARAWRLLRPHGRLIVSVPNEDCIPHRNHVRVFDRRSLRALLRPLGRPKLVTDQPYKWLLMYVDKA